MPAPIACTTGFAVAPLILGTLAPFVVAAPIVIDDFETGALNPPTGSISTVGGNAGYAATGLDASRVFTGRRNTFLLPNGGVSLSASLTPDGAGTADDAMMFQANGGGTLFLYYDAGYPSAPSNTDFTAGGNDRFAVTLTEAPSSGTLRIELWSTNPFIFKTVAIAGPGTIYVPFSSFVVGGPAVGQPVPNLDEFKAVDVVKVSITNPAGTGPVTYALSDVRVVPEPASLALIAFGGLALLRRAR